MNNPNVEAFAMIAKNRSNTTSTIPPSSQYVYQANPQYYNQNMNASVNSATLQRNYGKTATAYPSTNSYQSTTAYSSQQITNQSSGTKPISYHKAQPESSYSSYSYSQFNNTYPAQAYSSAASSNQYPTAYAEQQYDPSFYHSNLQNSYNQSYGDTHYEFDSQMPYVYGSPITPHQQYSNFNAYEPYPQSFPNPQPQPTPQSNPYTQINRKQSPMQNPNQPFKHHKQPKYNKSSSNNANASYPINYITNPLYDQEFKSTPHANPSHYAPQSYAPKSSFQSKPFKSSKLDKYKPPKPNNTKSNPVPSNTAGNPSPSPLHHFYCKNCEKLFNNIIFYDQHVATHEKCSFPDCDFEAVKKVVANHYTLIHGTYSGSGFKNIVLEGQKFCVLLGSNPEEVQQWLNERKKNFPTRGNIERKKREQEELAAAGGLTAEEQKKRKVIDDNQDEATKKKKKKKKKNSNGNGNPNDSVSVDDDSKLNATMDSTTFSAIVMDMKVEEVKDETNYNNESATDSNQFQSNPRTKRMKSTHDESHQNLHSNSNLLRKLLDDQIEVEENMILQCFKFLHDQNFFQAGSASLLNNDNNNDSKNTSMTYPTISNDYEGQNNDNNSQCNNGDNDGENNDYESQHSNGGDDSENDKNSRHNNDDNEGQNNDNNTQDDNNDENNDNNNQCNKNDNQNDNNPNPNVEEHLADAQTIARRQKTIEGFKKRAGYKMYILAVPINERRAIPEHPNTPDHSINQSNSAFGNQVGKWLKALKYWENNNNGSNDDGDNKEGNEAADSVSVEGSLNKETELTGNPETSTNKSQESEIGSTNDL